MSRCFLDLDDDQGLERVWSELERDAHAMVTSEDREFVARPQFQTDTPPIKLPGHRGVTPYGALIAHRDIVARCLEHEEITPDATYRNEENLAELNEKIVEAEQWAIHQSKEQS